MTEKPTGPSLGVQTGYLKIPGLSAKAGSYDFGVTCQTRIDTKAGPDSRRTTQPGSRPACWCLLSRGPADPHDGLGWRSAARVGCPGQEETPWANEAAARCLSPWDAAARESCPGTQLPACRVHRLLLRTPAFSPGPGICRASRVAPGPRPHPVSGGNGSGTAAELGSGPNELRQTGALRTRFAICCRRAK